MANTANLSLEVGKSSPWQTPTCVHAFLSQARRSPDATALRGPKSNIDGTYRELSYAELVWNAHTLMKEMISHLMKGKKDGLKGKAVAILLPRDVDYVVSMLACFFCGATYVPLSDSLPPARIAYILQDSEAIGVITCSDASISNLLSQAGEVFSSTNQETCRPPSMMLDWVDNLFWSSQPHRKELNITKNFHKQLVLPESHDVAYMIYTSGTTGNPKGVEVEHHSMLNVLLAHIAMESVTVEDLRRSVCVAAFIFDSHVREIWMPLVWGGCTCIAKDVFHMTEGIMSAGTPTGLIAATASDYFPSTIETAMVGGEPLTESLVQSLGQKGVKKIINAYGPTETVIECMTWKLDGIDSTTCLPEAGMPIGLPIPNVPAYGVKIANSGIERDPLVLKELLNSKTCRNTLAERGTVCELYIGGEGVARGYKNREDLTSEKFLPDPFSPHGGRMYQTGDLVIFGNVPGDPIQYVGRIDSQVKIRGKRLELGEIKTFLCASDDVNNAEVLIKNYRQKKQLVAYIVWNRNDHDASQEGKITQDLEKKMMKSIETLEDYKQPATIVSFPLTIDGIEHHSFPITPGGKVDLRKLPEPEEVKNCSEDSFQASSIVTTTCSSNLDSCNEIESSIVKAVQKILQLDSFGPNDDFFKAGLTSMEVPSLKFILKQELNLQRELSTECVFENSTALDLASYIANPQNSNNAPTISEDDFIESKYVKDKPLPSIVVWFLSTFTAIFSFATSLCFVFFLLLISVEALHEYGKCSKPVGRDLQNNCDNPDKWKGYWTVALGLPVVLPLCVCLGLVTVALMKWIVVGRLKPGCYSVDGLYYFRWLYAHHLEVFSIRWLLTALPFRCTFALNWWLRMMGANIGSNVVIDSLDIHEMCLLTIGHDVTIQNEAMITGHTFAKIRDNDTDVEGVYKNNSSRSKKNALILGKCWVKKGATLGPYSMVHPHLSCQKVRKNFGICTVVDGILPGYQSTSRLGQSIQLDPAIEQSHESLIWTPAITLPGQFEGIITSILLQCVAFNLVLAVMYHFFVPLEANFFTWIGRCYLFFSPWPMGIPYALIVASYKWIFIGRFKAGQNSSPRLDKYRWILQGLCRSRIQIAFEVAGASSEILNMFYRLMGMKVGWNAQVMPLNIVEYDLFTIGNNCSFGGQVMVCCRMSGGRHEPCSIGNDSAITNSAGMLAGSSIGNNCLVGNLTLLPPNFAVPKNSKCVGTKFCDGHFIRPVTFSNVQEKPTVSKLTSNLIVFSHILGSILIDLVYYTEFVLIGLIFTACQKVNTTKIGQMHLVHNPLKVHGGYLLVLATTIIATTISTLTIIAIKRSIRKFQGKHERDSILFVIFIWLTKQQMNMESWSYVFNGTPIQSFFYRLLGAEISLSSRLFMRYFVDVDGLVVGEKSILSYDCYLEQHKKTAFKLEFDPLCILKNVVVGQRSIVLKNVCINNDAHLYPLSAIAPKETTTSGELRGGILAEPYYLRHHEDALSSSAHALSTVSSRISSARSLSRLMHFSSSFSRSLKSQYLSRNHSSFARRKSTEKIYENDVTEKIYEDDETETIYENDVNMVVIGAGVSGIVAAHEFRQKNITVKVLEKSSKIMGCWQTYANQTSHVAVTEATYRLSGTVEDRHTVDYPSRDQVLAHGYDFFRKHKLDEVTEFDAEVVNIEDVAGSSNKSFKKKHGFCLVTYKQKGRWYKIKCKGVFIATGAQAIRNEISFPGEESFQGSIAFGSNDLGNAHELFKGKSVCIVGGGAFAIENVKTALTHGAKHVTLVHRNDIQVWPRCVHYLLSSEQNRKFSEYNELYLSVARWAGLSVGAGPSFDIAPFMHPGTSAQPTANDSFFVFYKAGLVSLVHGTVHHVHKDSVSIKHMREEGGSNSTRSEIPCEVFLKCVGWKDPGSIVRKIYPQFESRNFVFLNKSPRVAYVCDPRYRHENQVGEGKYTDILDTVPVGGTYSVPILSRIAATLQLYSLGVPLQSFDTMLESIPTSDQPLCSWIEAKFQYPKAKEISEVVRSVIDKHKLLVTEKHPTIDEFVAMNIDLLKVDLERRNACIGGCSEDIVGYVVGFEELLMQNRIAERNPVECDSQLVVWESEASAARHSTKKEIRK